MASSNADSARQRWAAHLYRASEVAALKPALKTQRRHSAVCSPAPRPCASYPRPSVRPSARPSLRAAPQPRLVP